MKLLFLAAALLIGTTSNAVDVNNIHADDDGTTTIEIHKGPAKSPEPPPPPDASSPPQWEVQDGNADIDGEVSATAKDARKAWQKACADWKKDFRADNKDNKILNLNCGSYSCSGEAGSKICSSKATYKIKTRMDQ